MGQQHHVLHLQELRVDRRLVLEDVEGGAGDLAGFDEARQRVLVDHLAAAGIHDVGVARQELEPARGEQVIGRRRVRAVDRDDVHARQHLVEALPIGGLELGLDVGVDPAPVVIVDRQAEAARAPRHRLADAAHADDAQALAPDALAEHGSRAPASPRPRAHQALALAQPARQGEEHGHGHVGGVLGEDAGGVGDRDAALARGLEVDVIDPGAEGGDQLQLRPGLGQAGGVDAVGHGRHQDVAFLARLDQLGLTHGPVVVAQAAVEQLHHARLDGVRQAPGDDDLGFLVGHARGSKGARRTGVRRLP